MRVPPKSTPILFYRHADKSSEPSAAIVLDSSPNGVCRVGIYPRQGGMMEVYATVHHVSDANLRDEHGNPSTAAVRHGGWDYHPWFLPPKDVSQSVPQEVIDKVRDLSREHDFDTVCKKVRNLSLTRSDVARICETA